MPNDPEAEAAEAAWWKEDADRVNALGDAAASLDFQVPTSDDPDDEYPPDLNQDGSLNPA